MTKPTRWRDVCAVPIDAAGGVPQVAHGASGSMAHRAPLLAALGLVTVLVGACGGSGAQAQSPPASTVTTSAPTAASGTPVAPTPKQRAGVDAIRQVRRYERLLDALTIHERLPLDRLYAVTTQPNVTDELAFLNRFRSAGDRQFGHVAVVSTKVMRGSLPSHSEATIQVLACIDVRHVHARGPDGTSIVPRSRKPYYRSRFSLVDRRYPGQQVWLIKRVIAHEVASCRA